MKESTPSEPKKGLEPREEKRNPRFKMLLVAKEIETPVGKKRPRSLATKVRGSQQKEALTNSRKERNQP